MTVERTKVSLVTPLGGIKNLVAHLPPVATVGKELDPKNNAGSRYGLGLHESSTGISPITGKRHV